MSRDAVHDDYEDVEWLGGEAFYKKKKEKRKPTREDAIYGVFAEEEDEVEKTTRRRPKRPHFAAKPVSFVSSGVVQDDDVRAEGIEIHLPKKAPAPEGGGSDSEAALPTAFGQKVRAGALKRQQAVREKADLKKAWKEAESTGFAAFEQHSRGIASKLMQKMGYRPGDGLGARNQGRVEPIVQKLRPKNLGMGYGDFKEQAPVAVDLPTVGEEDAAPPPVRLWRVGTRQARRERRFKTGKEVVDAAEELWKAPVLPTILDMRGPKARVLTDLTKLSQEARDDARPLGELQHNMQLLVEMTENEIKNLNAKMKTTEDLAVLMEQEVDRLGAELEEIRSTLKGRTELQERVQRELLPLDPFTRHDTLLEAGTKLQKSFPSEFVGCQIPVLLLNKAVVPWFEALFVGWQPLLDVRRGAEAVREWKELLSGHLKFRTALGEDPLGLLLLLTMLPSLRSAIVNIWRPRHPEPLLKFLDVWKGLLPETLMDHVCHVLVLPRLRRAVEEWDPVAEDLPVHVWIHPWLLWMAPKLAELYPTILHKLTRSLRSWRPSDDSALVLLSPWKRVFTSEQWTRLLKKAILPKLGEQLRHTAVNPLQHDVTAVEQVLAWGTVVPTQHLGSLLDADFFPKWMKVLHHWLTHDPDLGEVSTWYESWKSVFGEELLSEPRVANHFGRALDCMHRATEGLPLPTIQMLVREEEEKSETFRPVEMPRVAFTLREMMESFAEEKNVMFAPKLGRVHEGLQVYGFGGVSIVLDNAQNSVRGQFGQTWKPLSLEQLLAEVHNRS